MELLKGNGAECMVQFIKDGCKGVIYAKNSSIPTINRELWQNDSGNGWGIEWLSEPYEYYPPEPVWREVIQQDAYAACLCDKHVQAQNLNEPEEWWDIDLYDGIWRTKAVYRFRVMKD